MPQLIVDNMDTIGAWAVLEPDGTTPSTQLSLADETVEVAVGADHHSLRLSAAAGGLNHVMRRSLPTLDLSTFDELRLWLRATRVADGSPGRPFYLEVRLGSAAMGLTDPGNTWSRFLPVIQANTWELTRLSLDDLPPAVRGAVNVIQLRSADVSTTFQCILDDLLAVRDAMIGDLNAAMLSRLHQQVTVGGTPVPAAMYVPDAATTPAKPFIRVMHHDVQLADDRTTTARVRADFTATGYRLRPVSVGYDLYYQIDVVGGDAPQHAQILEFILRALAPRSRLVVNGVPVPIQSVTVLPFATTGERTSDHTLLHFVALTRQEVGAAEPVTPPYHSIVVGVDQAPAVSAP